ncbi:MAG: hypothetical protein IT445_06355 [Phycisphaeraceae bacterium]|nr:hypothetical protein [Phycisphaeraceae bacterium]
MRCFTCGKLIEEGDEIIEVRESIVGIRGFVSLDHDQYFCNVECLKRRFSPSGGHPVTLPRRVP